MPNVFVELYLAFFDVFSSNKNELTVLEELSPDLSFAGQTVLITGGTSGLGFETAIHYVNLGAERVIITARTEKKGEVAKLAIEKRTKKTAVVEVMTLDMDTFEGVKIFAKNLEREVRSIDIVLLNAGLLEFEHTLSPEGWEKDIQVNCLSNLLLGFLLIPWMQRVKQVEKIQHLGFVSSGSHIKVDIATWPSTNVLRWANEPANFKDAFHIYGVSKLLFMYGFQALVLHAKDQNGILGPVVNAVCPGVIRTNIGHGFADIRGWWARPLVWLWQLVKAAPTVEGTKCLVNLATTKEEEHGQFKRPWLTDEEYAIQSAPNLTSREGMEMQEQVWTEIKEVLIAAAPELKDIIDA